MSDNTESSIETLDLIIYSYMTKQSIPRTPRSFYYPIPKCHMWYQTIVPNMPLRRYRFFFRCSRQQFNHLLSILIDTNSDLLNIGNVPIEKKLHLYLYFTGNNAYITEIDDRFAMSDPMKTIKQMVEILNEKLYNLHVQWPNSVEKASIKQQFENKVGFKNIIGCIDGTHCQIGGIGKFRTAYTTRKCVYAMNLTLICTFDHLNILHQNRPNHYLSDFYASTTY